MNQENNSMREQQTAAALLEDERVPLGVRHWLEQYIREGEQALAQFETNRDTATMEQARLIYDVLDSKYQEVTAREFPNAARDYIEEYLYQLADASDIHVWNQPDLAVMALPVLLDCAPGSIVDDATTAALKIAVKALTTRRERRAFLRDFVEEADERKERRDGKAAMKLSRYLADPRTPTTTRNKLGATFIELAGELNIHADHPALVERAASITFESMESAAYPDIAKRLYESLHATLDELPDLPEGEDK